MRIGKIYFLFFSSEMIRLSEPSKTCELGRKRKRADCVFLEEYAKTHAIEGQGNKIIWNCQLYFICFLFHFFKTQHIDTTHRHAKEKASRVWQGIIPKSR